MNVTFTCENYAALKSLINTFTRSLFYNTVILHYVINHYVLFIQTILPLCLLHAFIFNSQLLCYTMFICQDTEKEETVRYNIGYSLCEDLCHLQVIFSWAFSIFIVSLKSEKCVYKDYVCEMKLGVKVKRESFFPCYWKQNTDIHLWLYI